MITIRKSGDGVNPGSKYGKRIALGHQFLAGDRHYYVVCRCTNCKAKTIQAITVKDFKKNRTCGCGRRGRRKPTREKLLARIKVASNGCWEWQGAKGPYGYGITYNLDLGRTEPVHRSSYREFVGEIPDGLLVCHTCDNRCCIRPQWLLCTIAGVDEAMEPGF